MDNESNCTFFIYVIGGAIKGCPSDITVPTDPGSDLGRVQWTPPVVDLPTKDWQFIWTHEPGEQYPIGDTRIVYSLLNPVGMEIENCTFALRVEDKEPPVFTFCPNAITQPVDAGHDSAVVTWGVPTATDNTRQGVTLTSRHNPGDEFPLKDTVIEYTATDVYDNEQICSFVITIEDNISPTFVFCPAAISVRLEKDDDAIPVLWQQPVAIDNADEPVITSNYQSGDVFQSGHATVTYVATDAASNTATCVFVVTVLGFPFNEFSRTSGYLLSGHDDIELPDLSAFECLAACAQETRFVCHSVDYNKLGSCRLSSGKAGVGDTTLVRNHAFDYYERLIDFTAPVLTGCPSDIVRTSEPGKSFATISWLPPSATDASPVQVVSTYQSGERFSIGDHHVIYTAIDAINNTVSCSFTVTIQDIEYPELIGCPLGPITRYTNGPIDEAVSWQEPTARDNSGVIDVSSNYKPGDYFPPGLSVVGYTATDPSGNRVECSFEVILTQMSDSHRLLLTIVLSNFAFSDALHDRRSDQFKELSDILDGKIHDVLNGDSNYQGAVTIGFRPGNRGGVSADVSLAFKEQLGDELRRQYLFKLLEAWKGNSFRVQIQQIYVTNQDGSNSTVDACLTLPCPSDMSCVASGLVCSSYCSDNQGFCFNKGSCVRHQGHDLVSCLCVDDNFYGRRCEKFELFNESKVYTVVACGIWLIAMLGLIGIGLKVAGERKRKKLDEENRKGSLYAAKGQVNYAFQLEADGGTKYHPASSGRSSTDSSVLPQSSIADNSPRGQDHDSYRFRPTSEEEHVEMTSMLSDQSDFLAPKSPPTDVTETSLISQEAGSDGVAKAPRSAWKSVKKGFGMTTSNTAETQEDAAEIRSKAGSRSGDSVNSACRLLDDVIASGQSTPPNTVRSLYENVEGPVKPVRECRTGSQPSPKINMRTKFQNSAMKASKHEEGEDEVIKPVRECRTGSQPSPKINMRTKFQNSAMKASKHEEGEAEIIKPVRESRTGSQPSHEINMGTKFQNSIMKAGKQEEGDDDIVKPVRESRTGSQPLPKINMRTKFQNSIMKASKQESDKDEKGKSTNTNDIKKRDGKKSPPLSDSSGGSASSKNSLLRRTLSRKNPSLDKNDSGNKSNNNSGFTVSSLASSNGDIILKKRPSKTVKAEIHASENA